MTKTDILVKRLKIYHSFFRDPNGPVAIPTVWKQYFMDSQHYLDITPSMNASSLKNHFAGKRMEFLLKYLPEMLKPTK